MARVQMKALQKIGGIAEGETFTVSEPQARVFEAIKKAERTTGTAPARTVAPKTAPKTVAAKKTARKVAKKGATYRTRDMKAAD